MLRTLSLTALAAVLSSLSLHAVSYETPTDIFDRWEEQGYGRVSGQVQYLYMYRDRDDNAREGDSGTTALTINYLSPEKSGLSLGLQYVYSLRLHEDGNGDNRGYNLLVNDDHDDFNELYIKARLDEYADCLKDTQLVVGRQILNYDFAPAYTIRQKSQAYEAIVLKMNEWEAFSVDFGHIKRFSSWASRYDGATNLKANFIDVEDRVGVGYETDGFQFISAKYDGIPHTKLAAYDFYGQDMFNTLGVKASYQWALNEGTLALKTHYADQTDVGRMDTATGGLGKIDTYNWEVAAEYQQGDFTGTAGINMVGGDDFQVPFRTSFTIDPELLWWTRQFDAKTDSLFAKATYKYEQWFFYMMYVNGDRSSTPTRPQMDSYEIDGVVKYTFNKHFYVAVKAGYGEQDPSGGRELQAEDARLFVGYKF